MRTKKLAHMAVALKTCQVLHEKGRSVEIFSFCKTFAKMLVCLSVHVFLIDFLSGDILFR